jgi:hypothetical protein
MMKKDDQNEKTKSTICMPWNNMPAERSGKDFIYTTNPPPPVEVTADSRFRNL